MFTLALTYIVLMPSVKGTLANGVDPEQMVLILASDQGLHGLHQVQEFLKT